MDWFWQGLVTNLLSAGVVGWLAYYVGRRRLRQQTSFELFGIRQLPQQFEQTCTDFLLVRKALGYLETELRALQASTLHDRAALRELGNQLQKAKENFEFALGDLRGFTERFKSVVASAEALKGSIGRVRITDGGQG